MGNKAAKAENLRNTLRGQLELFRGWSEETAIENLKTVRNFHIQYLLDATRQNINTGTAASLVVIERIQKIFQLMGVKGISAAQTLDEDYETARLVLGDAIDFGRMAAAAANVPRGSN